MREVKRCLCDERARTHIAEHHQLCLFCDVLRVYWEGCLVRRPPESVESGFDRVGWLVTQAETERITAGVHTGRKVCHRRASGRRTEWQTLIDHGKGQEA